MCSCNGQYVYRVSHNFITVRGVAGLLSKKKTIYDNWPQSQPFQIYVVPFNVTCDVTFILKRLHVRNDQRRWLSTFKLVLK
jgi:hypothetical protein